MKKIIACLDVLDGKTVKGVNFKDMRTVGDAVELGRRYADDGADELVYLDISATVEGRRTFIELIERLAAAITVPLTVGGGIASVADAERLRAAGATRVSVNSAALADPFLIDCLAERFGSDFVVAAIDGKLIDGNGGGFAGGVGGNGNGLWRVATHGGTRIGEREVLDWAREVERRGAGHILFTSMDHDGVGEGYPLDFFAALRKEVSLPIIASGGAGSLQDIADVLTTGRADVALVAGMFHFGTTTPSEVKEFLRAQGIL